MHPPPPPWLSILVFTSDPKSKQEKVKITNYKNAKNSNLEILQETLHATHLLMLLDKMYECKIDATRTVGAAERARDAGRTDRRTDGWSETNIHPYNFV